VLALYDEALLGYTERVGEHSMTAIVVARAGRGAVYSFKTVLLADNHPITQFGDPIITDADSLRQCLTMPECAAVAMKVGDADLSREIRDCPKEYKTAVDRLMTNLWSRLERFASEPPADPAEVMKRITGDRVATRSSGIHIRPRGAYEMSESDNTEANKGHEAEVSTEKKHRPIPKDPKYADTSVISLQADKDGKQYSADHNPKKPGSASHDRFTKYVDGMTVKEAKDAGLLNGDFDNDVKKGYISIV